MHSKGSLFIPVSHGQLDAILKEPGDEVKGWCVKSSKKSSHVRAEGESRRGRKETAECDQQADGREYEAELTNAARSSQNNP